MDPSNSHDNENADARTTRSRASSIISTGTKTSIGTMGTFLTTGTGLHGFTPVSAPSSTLAPLPPSSSSQRHQQQQQEQTTPGNSIDVLLGRRNFRISARPGSILSISSFDVPAPPYHEAIKTPAIPEDYRVRSGDTGRDGHQDERGRTEQTEREASEDEDDDENEDNRPSTSGTVVPLRSRPRVRYPRPYLDTDSLGPSLPRRKARRSAALNVSYPTNTDGDDDDDDDDEQREERGGDDVEEDQVDPTSPGAQTPLSIFSPALDPEAARNAISQHYTAIVRQIDGNHQAVVRTLHAEHEAQLAAQRTGLEVAHESALDAQRADQAAVHAAHLAAQRNDIDAAYRTAFHEMRAAAATLTAERDGLREELDAARARIAEQEATAADAAQDLTRVNDEVARLRADASRTATEAEERMRVALNHVEDVWEARWKQKMALAAEVDAKASLEFRCVWQVVEERWGRDAVDDVRATAKDRADVEESARRKKAAAAAAATVAAAASSPKKKLWDKFNKGGHSSKLSE